MVSQVLEVLSSRRHARFSSDFFNFYFFLETFFKYEYISLSNFTPMEV